MELQRHEMWYQMCVVYVGNLKIGGVEITILSLMFTNVSLAVNNSVTISILYAFDSYLQFFALFIYILLYFYIYTCIIIQSHQYLVSSF